VDGGLVQDVLALCVGLQLHEPEADAEPGQAIAAAKQVSQQIHRNQAPPREDRKPLARNSSQESQDFADGRFLADDFWQRVVRLDLVAVMAAVFLSETSTGRTSWQQGTRSRC
jgi:hypothetical protein